jgi:hypothetical protein
MKKSGKSVKSNAINRAFANVANFGKTMSKNASNSVGKIPLINKIPGEFKLVGVIALLVVALYFMQLITTPSFLKSQVNAVSGLVIADTPKSGVIEKQQVLAGQEQPKVAETPTPSVPVKIIGPEKGSTQASGFIFKTEYSSEVFICYYSVHNAGTIVWDRRTRPCISDLPITYCTSGKSCEVYVEVADANNNIIGSDTATYKIQ